MAIVSETRIVGPLTANGETVAFTWNFKVNIVGDVQVWHKPTEGDVELVDPADYTAVLNANQTTSPGGTVTFDAAPDAGEVWITTDTDLTQLANFANQGASSPVVIGAAMDKLLIGIQEARRDLNRALVVPMGETAPAVDLGDAGDSVTFLARRSAADGGGIYTTADIAAEAVNGPLNIAALGAVTTSSIHDILKAAALVANPTSREIEIPAGEWFTHKPCDFDKATYPNPVHIKASPGTLLKLGDNATETADKILGAVIFRQSGSSYIGGVIDANRDNQDKAAFNAAGGTDGGKEWCAIRAIGTSGSKISGVKVHAELRNSPDYACWFTWVDDADLSILVKTSGCGYIVEDGDDPKVGYEGRNLDNDGWKVYPHSADLFRVRRPTTRGRVHKTVDQSGYNKTAGTDTLSIWVSGFTLFQVDDPDVHIWHSFLQDEDMTKTVGVSVLAARGGRLDVTQRRATDVSLEMGGLRDVTITADLDGEFLQAQTLWPYGSLGASQPHGLHFIEHAPYPDFLSTTSGQCTGLVGLFKVRNYMSDGALVYQLSDSRIEFDIEGCRNGVVIDSRNTSSSFAQDLRINRNNEFTGKAIGCEMFGVMNGGAYNTRFRMTLSNNGQALSYGGALRNGGTFSANSAGYFSDGTYGDVPENNRLDSCLTEDTQTRSCNGSFDPAIPNVIWVADAAMFKPGRVYKFEGCGPAAADLYTWVISVQDDYITIADAASTVPIVAGTGTITTSSLAVTGTGTAFQTEITGNTFIRQASGSVYRRVRKLGSSGASDTEATLYSAFVPSFASPVSFEMVSFLVSEVPSQMYGIVADETNLSADMHDYGAGNTDGKLLSTQISAVHERGPHSLWFGVGSFVALSGTPTVDLIASSRWAAYLFSTGVTETIHASQFNPSGGTYRATVVWTNAGAGSGDVVWQLQWITRGDGEDYDVATSTQSKTVTAGAQDIAKHTAFDTLCTAQPGEVFGFRLSRVGGGADTLANDAAVIGLLLEYV